MKEKEQKKKILVGMIFVAWPAAGGRPADCWASAPRCHIIIMISSSSSSSSSSSIAIITPIIILSRY